MKHCISRGICLAVLIFVSPLAPAEDVLLSSPAATVTDADLKAELTTVPANRLADLVARPALGQQIVSDLLLRRVLAQKARAEGVDQDPLMQRRLKLLEERLLAEAYLLGKETEAVDPKVVEGLARTEYAAHPERFRRDEEVHVRHLLVSRNECDPEAAKARAEELRKRVLAGESFETLARENSADKGSAERGGDLGFIARGKTVKPFEDAAFALQAPGDVSEVVESKFGYHLIRLEERRSSGTVPFDEAREALVAEVSARFKREARNRILEDLGRQEGTVSDADAIAAAISRIAHR